MRPLAPIALCGLLLTSCSGSSALNGLHRLAVRCHVRGPLPDSGCTPGGIDPRVTESNIGATICVPGYTLRVRPPRSYTEALKRIDLVEYGFYRGRRPASYELDHLVPLEIGGSPRDPRNLWPEARTGQAGSLVKDREENLLRRRVCAGNETLASAQHDMASDWLAAYRRDHANANLAVSGRAARSDLSPRSNDGTGGGGP